MVYLISHEMAQLTNWANEEASRASNVLVLPIRQKSNKSYKQQLHMFPLTSGEVFHWDQQVQQAVFL